MLGQVYFQTGKQVIGGQLYQHQGAVGAETPEALMESLLSYTTHSQYQVMSWCGVISSQCEVSITL